MPEALLRQGRRLLFALLVAASAGANDPPQLAGAIERELARAPHDRAIWGILVEAEDGEILYARNADRLLIPASNRKLFSAAAIAACRPLDERITTELRVEGGVSEGVLVGNVILRGHGDPSLAGRLVSDRDQALQPFLTALLEEGIVRIDGAVIGDSSAFDGERLVGSWKSEHIGQAYAAPIDALAFNENVAGVFIGGNRCDRLHVTTDPSFLDTDLDLDCQEGLLQLMVTEQNEVLVRGQHRPRKDLRIRLVSVRDPALYAARALDERLRRASIPVRDFPRSISARLPDSRAIGVARSPYLFELLAIVLEDSSNHHTETLFKRLAARAGHPASREEALVIEGRFLIGEVGLEPGSFSFDDASGLSAENLVTPRSILRLLRYLHAEPRRGIFDEIMPAPGEGTLRARLAPLQGRLVAKTGTLDRVGALSGRVSGRKGGIRFFSVIANNHPGAPQEAIDRIVTAIANF